MSAESRVIRPFRTFDRLEAVLREHARLVATDGSDPVAPDEVLMLDRNSFVTAGLSLALAPDRDVLRQIREVFDDERRSTFGTRQQLALVVMLSTPRLRYADVVVNKRLDQPSSVPMSIELAPRREGGGHRPRPLLTARGGCRVDVLVLLDHELPSASLVPWRKGSWLARLKFDIRSQIHDSGFQPLPLDDEVRQQYLLGDRVQHFMTLRDGVESVARASTLDSVVEYYVDPSTLEFISETPRGTLETQLQTRFVLDAVTFFVNQLQGDDEVDSYSPDTWDDTLLHGLARLASESRAPDEQELRDMVDLARRKPYTFIARLEQVWNMRGITEQMLENSR